MGALANSATSMDGIISTNAFTSSVKIGAPVNALDASADGQFLIVGEGSASQGQAAIDQITLSNMSLQRFPVSVTSAEYGINSLAIDQNDAVVFSARGNDAAPFELGSLQSKLTNPTTINGPLQNESDFSLISAEDHRYVLVEVIDSSWGPSGVYDAHSQGLVSSLEPAKGSTTSIFNLGLGEINSHADRIVNVTANTNRCL